MNGNASGNATLNLYHPIQCEQHIDTPAERTFKCIAYFIIMFGSLIGNVLVICVVILNRQMRTVENYLIVNMAMAELLLTVFNMPVIIKVIATGRRDWADNAFADILCKVLPFILSVSLTSSILSLTAIAISRFLAIMYPLKRYITFHISYGMIALIWVVGIAANFPLLFTIEIVQIGQKSYCALRWTLEAYRSLIITEFMVFYVVPLSIMSVLYSFVVHKVWVRKTPGNQTAETQLHVERSKKKILKMLVAVVMFFALCWLPSHVTVFILFFDRENFPCGPPATLTFMSSFLVYANSAINPAIYTIFNSNFRKGIRDVLWRVCYRNRRAFVQTGSHQNPRIIKEDDARIRKLRMRSTDL